MLAHALCLLLASTDAQAQTDDASTRVVLEEPRSMEVDSEVALQRELGRLRLAPPAIATIVGGIGLVGLAAGTVVSALTMSGCDGDFCTFSIAPIIMGSLITVPLIVILVSAPILGRRLRRHREIDQRLALAW